MNQFTIFAFIVTDKLSNVTLPKAVRGTVEIFAVCFTTSSTTKTYVCSVNLRVITMVEFQIEAVLAYLHMICYGLPKVVFLGQS